MPESPEVDKAVCVSIRVNFLGIRGNVLRFSPSRENVVYRRCVDKLQTKFWRRVTDKKLTP